MTINRFFAVASALCFAIALLIAVSVVSGSELNWTAGGLLALALSFAV